MKKQCHRCGKLKEDFYNEDGTNYCIDCCRDYIGKEHLPGYKRKEFEAYYASMGKNMEGE